MAAKPKSIDEYLAAVSDDQRVVLENLRQTIRKIAPQAQEYINYGVAAFQLDGKALAGFGAGKNHCSYFPMSGTTVATLKNDLKGYDTSKGAIRFTVDKPLPVALVKKLIKTRIAEIEQQLGAKKKKGGTATKKLVRAKAASESSGTQAVDDFLKKLDHPLKPVLESLRTLILGTDAAIGEGIKWNAPSFHLKDYFATTGLRSKDFVHVVLHRGAKVKDNATQMHITDPAGLLEWHAKDRCSAKFFDRKDFQAKAAAFQDIVKQWIKQL